MGLSEDKESFQEIFMGLGLSACVIGLLMLAMLPILKSVVWLQDGAWPEEVLPGLSSFASWLTSVGVDLDPIYNPTRWIGLAKIVRWFLELPSGVHVSLLGALILYVASLGEEDF